MITTPSFELAAYVRGDPNARRLALVLPGKLDTKEYPHMRSHVEYLATKGFLAVSFDPPGTWESPGRIESYTTTNYLKAINELIAHFGNRPTVLIGHSRGGSMAMLAGTKNSCVTHIIAMMSRFSPSPLSAKAQENGFEISYRDTPSGEKRMFKLPLSYFKDSARYDLFGALAACTQPKLFVLGTRDTIIVPSSVRDAFEKAAEPKRLCVVDSDHVYRQHPKIIDEINAMVGTFLDETNAVD